MPSTSSGNWRTWPPTPKGRTLSGIGDARVWQQGLAIAMGLALCLVLVIGFPALVTRPLRNLLERIEQIARDISDIRDLSNEAVQTPEQSNQASQHLSRLSSGLAQLVGRFRG
jgi:F0F1-type ATP synthase membrane subunit b/b'